MRSSNELCFLSIMVANTEVSVNKGHCFGLSLLSLQKQASDGGLWSISPDDDAARGLRAIGEFSYNALPVRIINDICNNFIILSQS